MKFAKIYMWGKRRLLLVGILCLSLVLFAQNQQDSIPSSQKNFISSSQQDSITQKNEQKVKIDLENADVWEFDEERMPDAQILVGNVVFRQDSSYMYCDSAYFYEKTNSLDAFGNVRMEQGDTLFIYGDLLFYDGNTKIARLRENIRMENQDVTLFTDSLNYDRNINIGYYFNGGLIVDSENELSSYYGQYSPDTKIAIFNDSVRLENPKFVLYSDTLHYNTENKVATILGSSTIVSDSSVVHSSRGWFDTINNTSKLYDRSEIVSGPKILIGDSIYYNRALGIGEAFGNMILRDTTQKAVLEGNYGYFNNPEGIAFATDSAKFLEYSQGDTLFLHADTLQMITLDSISREIKAYYGVRFYRTDMQGVCDSMQYNTQDSILYMYKEPVLWNETYQLYGDTILIYTNDSTIDFAHVKQFAFAAQEMDSSYYNQLKGNDLKAFFSNQKIDRIEVAGNAESIFYPLEDDGSKIGMNETKSGFLNIWVKDNKLEKLKIWPSPQGTLTPIPDLDPSKKTLKNFEWYDYLRPKDKDDIFQVVERKSLDIPKQNNDIFKHTYD
ncbi:OstA-like protein [Parabacteroides pacaensis]|uniref:OstA-like protein n=1 Tax=Parabacteroides pacaensis TaxID=2086575 RepID=UPI001F1E6ED4|nr:OstA-like protein [Parabacteroides pacaensis]